MKEITINHHVREAKTRNEQCMQDQVYDEWKPFPSKGKGIKADSMNKTKETIRNPQENPADEACELGIPSN